MTPQELALRSISFKKLKELSKFYADEVLRNPVFANPNKQGDKWKSLYREARCTRAERLRFE